MIDPRTSPCGRDDDREAYSNALMQALICTELPIATIAAALTGCNYDCTPATFSVN